MTLIDHLIETGRIPDTETVYSGRPTATAEGQRGDVPWSRPDEATVPAEAADPGQRTQRLDHNAIAPQGAKLLAAVHGYVRQSALPARLVELVYLRISQLNGCAYCIDMHSRDLGKAGLPSEQLLLVQVWREAAPLFDEQERAALAWAEAVTRLGEHGVSDEDYADASAAFTPKDLTDLTIAIGLMNAYNRLAISFRTTPQTVRELP